MLHFAYYLSLPPHRKVFWAIASGFSDRTEQIQVALGTMDTALLGNVAIFQKGRPVWPIVSILNPILLVQH